MVSNVCLIYLFTYLLYFSVVVCYKFGRNRSGVVSSSFISIDMIPISGLTWAILYGVCMLSSVWVHVTSGFFLQSKILLVRFTGVFEFPLGMNVNVCILV